MDTPGQKLEMIVITDGDIARHTGEIFASRDAAPDEFLTVGHRHCGDLTCERPDMDVTFTVSWLDGNLRFKVTFVDEHKVCRQTLTRAQRLVEKRVAERDRQE